MHILKVILILKLFLEVLLHHGERRMRCAAGELLVVYKLSLGLKELVTVLTAILALLWKTKGLGTGRPYQFSVIFNYHPTRSSMTVWLNKWLFSEKEKNLKRNKDASECFIIML